jgi:CheY-like chemotaxis protein
MALDETSKETAVQYPPEIFAQMRGSRFLVVGFDDQAADRILRVLGDLGTLASASTAEHCRPASCDAAVLNFGDPILRECAPNLQVPVIAIGSTADVLTNVVGICSCAPQFLLSPWSADEFVARAFCLLAAPRMPVSCKAAKRTVVLIADDDPDLTALLTTTLNSHMDCRIVRDGLAALHALHDAPPNALILDVNMPVMNGFEVLERIRRNPGLKRLPIILLTAADGTADIERGKALGADDYIVKPFGVNALIQRVRRLVTIPPI